MYNLSIKAYNTGKVNSNDFNNFEFEEAEIHLCYTNAKRKQINNRIMKTLKRGLSIQATDYDYISNEYTQDVIIKKDTPVMSVKTDKEKDIFNNEKFVVSLINKEEVITLKSLLRPDTKIEIKKEEFNQYFVVAYAMTVHKSQGQTFNFKYMIHETNLMTNRMLYTALTRTTNKDFINIHNGNKESKAIYNDEFYQNKINGYTI